jgi:serine/threonine protein kinase
MPTASAPRTSSSTPGFVAPEVVHRLALDARTDLFSLGATLYYALTGCAPFAARTLAELATVWGEEPAPPSERVPGIPTALDALVLSMLRIDPDRRPGSAFEVMQRLAASSRNWPNAYANDCMAAAVGCYSSLARGYRRNQACPPTVASAACTRTRRPNTACRSNAR